MKIFGYIDDFLTMWFNWQVHLPLKYCIPLSIMEIMLFVGVIFELRRVQRGY